MLYYQFLKHAFGFRYSPHSQSDRAEVEVLLDDVPQKKEDFEQFKDYLSSLSVYPYFRQKGVSIRRESIGSIDSKNHNILQAVDLVLGAMHFRLNDLHLAKPEGQRTRGKRTRSKERVYKKVNSLIRTIYPGFNIGTSTGQKNGATDRWNHPYRHWLFVPSDSKVDLTRAKGRGK
jgi:hypothetical protein